MQFDEVKPEHFNTISRTPPPHSQIEQALTQLGGGDVEGTKYRKEVLAAAGWKHSSLVSFGKYPDEASFAFNKVRDAMANHEEASAILAAVKTA